MTARRFTALVGVLLALHGCGGDDPSKPDTGPTPGTLSVNLTVPAGGDDGAVLLEVSGPAITGVTAAGSLELFDSGPGASHKIIVVGDIRTGTVLRVQVPDVGRVDGYSARLLQVAGHDHALGDPARYGVEVVKGS